MTAVDRLIEQLKARGLGIIRGTEAGQLLLTGPNEAKTPLLIEAVKAFKPLLLEWIDREPQLNEPVPEDEKPGEQCEVVPCDECGKVMFVHGGDRDTAFLACQVSGNGTLLCPFWRRGLTDDWWDKARWFEERRRRELAAKREKDSEPIPE